MSRNFSLTWGIDQRALIAFYYLLRISKYTVKLTHNSKKQTVQFKLEDVSFFKKDKLRTLRCIPCTAPLSVLLTADIATLILDNQKNGWKGVCVHQEANDKVFNCQIWVLVQHLIHLRENNADGKTFLSVCIVEGKWFNVTGEDISKGLTMAETILDYPILRGIPISCINTHSL